MSALPDWAEPEDLCDELAAYLEEGGRFGQCIRHPLVYSIMHHPAMNKMLNQQLRQKQQALVEARKAREWHTYCFLHERPYRLTAFTRIKRNLTDAQYWGLLGTLWIDSENIRQNPQQWEVQMTSERPDRSAIMKQDERQELAELPDIIPVFQGHTAERDDGMSWTTKRSTAIWFAHRFANLEDSPPRLTSGRVHKADVIAYFTRRNESEIVAERILVGNKKTTSPRRKKSEE